MRIRRSAVVAVLSVPALIGVTGCGELQEAQQNVDQAQRGLDSAATCAKAVHLMGFTPDFTNPEKAASDARTKVDEIGRLAQETNDQTLKQNLQSVQASMEQAAAGSIAPEDVPGWVQKHVERTNQVLQACNR